MESDESYEFTKYMKCTRTLNENDETLWYVHLPWSTEDEVDYKIKGSMFKKKSTKDREMVCRAAI